MATLPRTFECYYRWLAQQSNCLNYTPTQHQPLKNYHFLLDKLFVTRSVLINSVLPQATLLGIRL